MPPISHPIPGTNLPPHSMSMKIVTWNVQGLRSQLGQQNIWKLRRDLEEYILGGAADIIMLQKHHLDSTRLKEVEDLLPGSWRTIWEPTIGEDGNHVGICTLIREHLAQGLIQDAPEGGISQMLEFLYVVLWWYLY